MTRQQARARKLANAQMNMTPMMDVTFQLLIFFMFCTEIAKIDQQVSLTLPKIPSARPDEKAEVKRLVINIDKDGNYVVGGKTLNGIADLRKLLEIEVKLRTRSDKDERPPVLVRCDENVGFVKAHLILYLAMQLKIRKLSFAAAPLQVKH